VKFSEIYGSSRRFNAESSSLNRFPLQFKREFTTGSSELKRDRRGEIEKKKERRFKGFEPAEKKKKRLPIYFRIQAKKSTNRIKFKSS